MAQDVLWDHPALDYKDAIRWQIGCLETYDEDHLIPHTLAASGLGLT